MVETEGDKEASETTRLLPTNEEYLPRLFPAPTGGSVNVDNNDYLDRTSSDSSILLSSTSPRRKTQGSIITIFNLWSTMMGTSILTMPWALQQAGFAFGIFLMIAMMGICLYTAYRVIDLPRILGLSLRDIEFSDMCRNLLGSWAEWISVFFSVLSLLGAIIVYWVLMSNFLYNTVTFTYNNINNSTVAPLLQNKSSVPTDVYCPNPPVPPHINVSEERLNLFLNIHEDNSTFTRVWTLKTAPVFLLAIVGPLVNFKSSTLFTKLNAVGTLSVVVVFLFIGYKANVWGININWTNKNAWDYVPQSNANFPALIGTLTLAYFIHNCVISIMKNQRNQKNNVRDLLIGYILVCTTYLLVGVMFLLAFPLNKLCIEDNLLNNLHNSDIPTSLVRIFLFLQMLAVLPLLMYVIRSQILHKILGPEAQPKLYHILPINALLATISVLFAVFYPHISMMIRFTGAVCGLVYTFALPCLTYMIALARVGKLSNLNRVVHFGLILFGVVNLISQFFVKQRF